MHCVYKVQMGAKRVHLQRIVLQFSASLTLMKQIYVLYHQLLAVHNTWIHFSIMAAVKRQILIKLIVTMFASCQAELSHLSTDSEPPLNRTISWSDESYYRNTVHSKRQDDIQNKAWITLQSLLSVVKIDYKPLHSVRTGVKMDGFKTLRSFDIRRKWAQTFDFFNRSKAKQEMQTYFFCTLEENYSCRYVEITSFKGRGEALTNKARISRKKHIPLMKYAL